jgi:MFS transporter, DHA2 family, multidrug resistance protein
MNWLGSRSCAHVWAKPEPTVKPNGSLEHYPQGDAPRVDRTRDPGPAVPFNLGIGVIVGSAPPERAGAASATAQTAADFGGALGIALLGSIGTAVYRTIVSYAIPAGVPLEAAAAARDTLGGAVTLAGQLPDQLATVLLAGSRDAFVGGLHLAVAISAILMLASALVAAAVLRGAQTSTEQHVERGVPAAAES